MYSTASLQEFEGHVDRTILSFMNTLAKHAETVIDLGLWLQLFAFGKWLMTVKQSTPTSLFPAAVVLTGFW